MQTSSSPRKILMTVDPIGGVWTYALELARALEPYGIEVAFASMGGRLSRGQHEQVVARKNVRLFESAYRLEWTENPWGDVDRAGVWLLQVADRVRADLVHLNNYSHATLPWNAPVLVAAHSCVLSWWRAVKSSDAPTRYDEYRARVAAGLAAADLVVAPSAHMRNTLRFHYGVDCIVIRNGRDPRLFSPAEKLPMIFGCGRIWDQAKNFQLFDQVAPQVEWRIIVAGDTRHPGRERVALENISHLGKLSDREIAQQFARAAIFVLPARYEPFGLSALEAALSGCTLVLGDIPSLREIWGDAAIFVSPDDANGLSHALNNLIADQELRETLSSRARARALQFSPQRMGQGYLAAYRRCAQGDLPQTSEQRPSIAEEVAA
jgi:glycosyltransferase involved in cell wall biosynthesis